MLQNDTIKARMEKAERLVAEQDEGLFDTLSALLEDAVKNSDQVLEGFVHYQYASAYFDLENEENMLHSLQNALGLLLIGNAREWISRSYNLFAVYAKQLGCLDMAYNYFLLAYSYVENEETSLSRAMVEGNFGDLLADTGDYRKACAFSRKSLKTLSRLAENRQVNMYKVFGTINLGIYLLLAGDVSGAAKALARGEKLLKKTGRDTGDMAVFWYKLAIAQLALAVGDHEKIPSLAEDVISRIEEKPVFALFAREIRQFGNALISGRQWEYAIRLIRVAEEMNGADSTVYVRLMVARLKTDYYYAAGNKKAFHSAHMELHILLKELGKRKRSLSFSSAKLMMMNEGLRKERDRIMGENVRLYKQARTDALTSLPNRYALNEHMNLAFEKAQKEQTRFGFGIVDIDSFKKYNDSFGHAAGDKCLVSVADTLKRIADEYGFFVSRYGGDEFTMIFEDMDEVLIGKIENEINSRVHVRVSFGYYADIPDENARQWDYMTKADALMYRKKRGLSVGF